MNEERARELETKSKVLGDDLFYALKDEDGSIAPLSGLWKSDGYGKEMAEERASKISGTEVVLVRVEPTEVTEGE